MNPGQTYELQRGSTLAVRGGEGLTVRVCGGKLWMTQPRDSRDYMLGQGDRAVLNGKGTALIYAFEPGSVTLARGARVELRRRGEVRDQEMGGVVYAIGALLLSFFRSDQPARRPA